MLITLTGENTFAIAQAERQLVADFTAEFGMVGLERIDGEQFEPTRLGELVQGASLFAPQRMVVLKNAGSNKPLWDALADWVAKIPSETTLIITQPAADKRTKTYKTLKTTGDFREFAAMQEYQLAKWLQGLGDIGQAEATYLIERTGPDQWRLAQEMSKLAGAKITKQRIDDLVEPTPQASAFELLDAVLAGKTDQLNKLIEQLKTQEDPYKLLGLLASQVHGLALLASASGQGTDEIAKLSGLHPFVLRKSQGLAKRLGGERVGQIVWAVADCDLRLKTTGAEPWQLLGLTLQKIAAQ